MRHWNTAGFAIVFLALGGCGGQDDVAIRPDELPVACVAKANPGYCSGSIHKFYYDYRDNRCKTFYWSGCGGHVPYHNMEECRKQCEGRS